MSWTVSVALQNKAEFHTRLDSHLFGTLAGARAPEETEIVRQLRQHFKSHVDPAAMVPLVERHLGAIRQRVSALSQLVGGVG